MVRYQKSQDDGKEKKVSFWAKENTVCPVCEQSFKREELFGGRVNAGDLTDELHREYIPMAAFGEVNPLLYELTVCPSCYFSAFKGDFLLVSPEQKSALEAEIEGRIASTQGLFSSLDFQAPRGICEGTASYYLAMICYDSLPIEQSPTIKQAICGLRAAWLFKEIDAKFPKRNYDFLSRLFYQKALFLYKRSIELEQKGIEPISNQRFLGPDTDKNYGFEGVLYLCGLLELKYGQKEDPERRAKDLENSKRAIAKMFGLGKSSKKKPGPLLDKARELYDILKAELHQEDDE
jgi:uncharacterized protein (DUF2225 family)